MSIDDSMKITKQTALRIRRLRTHHNMSQEELAFSSDISTTYLGQLERGQKTPTVEVINKICNALNITLSEFFMFDDVVSDDKYKLAYKNIEIALRDLPVDSAWRLSLIIQELAALNRKM